METVNKIKEWVKENAPMVSGLYENKYVGMAYDRFGSLPPKQQKQIIIGTFCGILAIVLGYLFLSYLSLFSYSGRAKRAYEMVNQLQQYQRQMRDKSGQVQALERNSMLAGAGQLRQHLISQARAASISPKMIEVDERPEEAAKFDDKGGGDIRMKQASVTLQRVNLLQLKNFLTSVEFGSHNLSVSSIRVTNDDKIRGYMKVEMGIVAYLFSSSEGGG